MTRQGFLQVNLGSAVSGTSKTGEVTEADKGR